MPEHVKHISHPLDDTNKKTLCTGKILYEFQFTGLDHAFLTREQDGRQLVCKKCIEKAVEVLSN